MNEALRAKPCPVCGKPADAKLMPFCSPRCADVDLNRWFTGAYAIPAGGDDDAEEAEAAPARDKAPNSDA